MGRLVAALAFLVIATPAFARPIHIVAYGDSMTAGWLVKPQEAYPAQLQAALRKKGFDVTVKNAGINGGTTLDALLHFDEAIAPGTNIALVEFGTNDLRQHASMRTVRARLTELIRSLRARKIEVMVIGFASLKLNDVAAAQGAAYAEWKLPPGQYRARDHAHYNAQGYAIVVTRMLPEIERLIGRIRQR